MHSVISVSVVLDFCMAITMVIVLDLGAKLYIETLRSLRLRKRPRFGYSILPWSNVVGIVIASVGFTVALLFKSTTLDRPMIFAIICASIYAINAFRLYLAESRL